MQGESAFWPHARCTIRARGGGGGGGRKRERDVQSTSFKCIFLGQEVAPEHVLVQYVCVVSYI